MRSVIRVVAAMFIIGVAGNVDAQDVPPAAPSPSFPAGAKYAYVDLQRVLAESTEGQAANAKVQELTDSKLAEIEARNQELQGQIGGRNQTLVESQQKLEQGQSILSAEARLSLQREISRLQLEIQRETQDAQAEMERVTQDAEAEVGELQQVLQLEFEQRLAPALEQVAMSRGVDFLFNVGQGGVIWANRELDLTQDVVDQLNAAATSP